AERENDIRAEMERTGVAYEKAAAGVDQLRASRKGLTAESRLAELRDQGQATRDLIAAQRLGPVELGQSRAAQAAERQIKADRITDPAQADALRHGASGQVAYEDRLEREGRLLNELRGPRQQAALDLEAIRKLYAEGAISAEEFADAQNKAALRGLAASRSFADGAELALRRYADEAGNAAAQADRVVTGGLRGMENGLTDFATGTKTAAEAFSAMAAQIINDLIRMQIQANITSKISDGITAAGGVGGLFGRMFGGDATASGGSLDATGVDMTGGGGWWPFAGGGIMTSRGKVPLRTYSGGGIANSPQAAIFGEGATPEAYVPVPSGRIPVELRLPRPVDAGNSVHLAEGAVVVNAPGATAAVPAILRGAVQQSVGAVRGLADRGGSFAKSVGRR
ncbi:MAG: hypothetical protein HQL34_13165, partial [Alphaproteobacteria bacterium]|nr:hypothetical protein [Alphaproteobacteria bacterium]